MKIGVARRLHFPDEGTERRGFSFGDAGQRDSPRPCHLRQIGLNDIPADTVRVAALRRHLDDGKIQIGEEVDFGIIFAT